MVPSRVGRWQGRSSSSRKAGQRMIRGRLLVSLLATAAWCCCCSAEALVEGGGVSSSAPPASPSSLLSGSVNKAAVSSSSKGSRGSSSGEPREQQQHKSLWPPDQTDYMTFCLAAVGLIIAASGGIGGGGMLVPLYMLVGGFDAKTALPLSSVTILGGAIANTLAGMTGRHPLADRPLQDWGLIVVMEPMCIIGLVIGTFLNRVLPTIVTAVLLLLILTLLAHRTLKRGIIRLRKDLEGRRPPPITILEERPLLGISIQPSVRDLKLLRNALMDTDEEGDSAIYLPSHAHAEDSAPAPALGKSLRALSLGMSFSGSFQREQSLTVAPGLLNSLLAPDDDDSSAFREEDEDDLDDDDDDEENHNGHEAKTAATGRGRRTHHDPAPMLYKATSADRLHSSSFKLGRAKSQRDEHTSDRTKLIQAERRVAPWKPAVLTLCVGGVILLLMMRGGGWASGISSNSSSSSISGSSALPHVRCGSAAYWVLSLAAIPWVLTFFVFIRKALLKEYDRKAESFFPFAEGDVHWTRHSTLKFPAICVAAGMVSGMLGVGGGVVQVGPSDARDGLLPPVAAASVAVMVLYSSATSSLIDYALGLVPLDYGILCLLFGFASTAFGQFFLNTQMPKYKRDSAIILSIGLVIALSALLMTVQSLTQGLALPRHTLTQSPGLCAH